MRKQGYVNACFFRVILFDNPADLFCLPVNNACDHNDGAVARTGKLFYTFSLQAPSIAVGNIPRQLMNLLNF